MKLEDIEKMIPNGFHDALLERISIDYVKRCAVFDLHVLIGDPRSEDRESREAYREGQLRLNDLLFCVIEPPDPAYSYHEAGRLLLGAGSLKSTEIPSLPKLPEPLPEGAFAHWFFVQKWNAFLYVAAMDAYFEWKGGDGQEKERVQRSAS